MTDDSDVIAALHAVLGPAGVIDDADVATPYRYDRASAVEPGRPLVVVRPASTAEVQVAVRIAAAHHVPIVTRGAGTGLSGGSSALDGAITLSTDRMRSVHVDAAAQVAVVQPGALNAEVKVAAAEHGLWYPPDPSSFEICSVGGNVATNAGGLCCVRYGVTTDYVLGLEVVMADGRAVRLGGRTVKDVAGYDLKRLFIGSEGTLGIVTEVTLRLRPPPPATTTIVATFDDVVHAGVAVAAVMSTLRPDTLELMDAAAVAAVERVRPMGLVGVGALLLAQCGTGGGDVAELERCLRDAGANEVAASSDADEGELLMGARRMAIPCVERLGTVLIEDVGVPIPRVGDLVAEVAAIAERTDTLIPVIGHAGDGNLHPLVTFDASDAAATERAREAFDDIMGAALALGGTITGEHGVGILKARHLAAQLGPDVIELHRRIKMAFDPDGVFNPGKWI
ncbi:MAG: FAD-binding protein [Actinobacteria bacterium]|nr:FAD-binding protein [Actinomycetota bacterium]